MPTKIRPIVFKINEPEGFVMNARNATVTPNGSIYVAWESPSYPDGYNGNGKQYIVTNNNTAEAGVIPAQMMYGGGVSSGGPTAISETVIRTIGTSTGTMEANPAAAVYGKYLVIAFNGIQGTTITVEQVNEYLANFTITILDP